jgi:hypothetical protein
MHSAWWIAIAAPLLWIEYVTGAYTQFPVVYVIPVSLAAWYSGRWPALTLAVAIPLAHLTFAVVSGTSEDMAALVAATTIRGAVIIFMALWFARLSGHERELRREVHVLKGLLQICSFCRCIRNESGEWEHLERFISRRSETQFSHGLCPSCQQTHYSSLGEPPGGV